jgi:hypothetical protein
MPAWGRILIRRATGLTTVLEEGATGVVVGSTSVVGRLMDTALIGHAAQRLHRGDALYGVFTKLIGSLLSIQNSRFDDRLPMVFCSVNLRTTLHAITLFKDAAPSVTLITSTVNFRLQSVHF